jgi:hypothetical protein
MTYTIIWKNTTTNKYRQQNSQLSVNRAEAIQELVLNGSKKEDLLCIIPGSHEILFINKPQP